MSRDGVSRFDAMKWVAWMVGIVALSICVAVIFPLLLPVAGTGERVYFRMVPTQSPPFALSDAFVVVGTFVGFWCVGWAVSRLIDRWVDRRGRSPGVGFRLLITVVTCVAVVLICDTIPIHVSYASTVAVGCAIVVVTMIGNALRRRRDA
jgi:amino acid transporter